MAVTSNLQGHMQEFYAVYAGTLRQLGKDACLDALHRHIAHRATIAGLTDLFQRAGFRVVTVYEQSATMRFLDGSALLRHSFIKMGFLSDWLAVLGAAPREEKVAVFTCLEDNLNKYAESRGELALTIPMVYMEAEKE
jgi:hypothetical protein